MKSYKTRGIVLHTIKYGDSSLVVYMLTSKLGRRTYMVRGVKSGRGGGNKAALLQSMFVVEFEGLESPRAEMHRLREMSSAVTLLTTPFDVRKSTVALFMAELLYRLVREVEANSPLYDFVEGAVVALDGMTGPTAGTGVANFHLWFMVALSRHLGFFPGNEWHEGWWFDIREGLFTPQVPRGGAFFPPPNAAMLGRLMDIAGGADLPSSLAEMKLNRTERVEFLNAMLAYFGYHLDATRDIRSVEILREVF